MTLLRSGLDCHGGRVVDEAREAGIEHLIFVTGRNEHIIEDHFDRQIELEMILRDRQRAEVMAALQHDLPPPPGNNWFHPSTRAPGFGPCGLVRARIGRLRAIGAIIAIGRYLGALGT